MTDRISQRPPSQRGMVSLAALSIFVIVAGMLVAAAVARNMFAARDLHRDLIEKQAEWLAESAIERALSALHSAPDPLSIEPQSFEERIAPVYINQDPLVVDSSKPEIPNDMEPIDEPMDETVILEDNPEDNPQTISADLLRAMTAKYGFRIVPAPEELVRSREEKTVIIYAQCEIPYRQSIIAKQDARLCRRAPGSGWESLPLVNVTQ